MSNAQAYDEFFIRRTAELTAGGRSHGEAETIAENEAQQRFGPRVSNGGTRTVIWNSGKAEQSLSLAELDETVTNMKKKSGGK